MAQQTDTLPWASPCSQRGVIQGLIQLGGRRRGGGAKTTKWSPPRIPLRRGNPFGIGLMVISIPAAPLKAAASRSTQSRERGGQMQTFSFYSK